MIFHNSFQFFTGSFETSVGLKTMSSQGIQTVFILKLMDGVADAMNGIHSNDWPHARRIPWINESYHTEFLTNFLRQLKNIQFIDPKTREPFKTDIPSLYNFDRYP